jgi:serine/threonine-protein kinase ULK2
MYLVMEFCAGGDLAHFIRRCKRVPEVTAHGLMLQLAAGLQEMWSHNLVHVSMPSAVHY